MHKYLLPLLLAFAAAAAEDVARGDRLSAWENVIEYLGADAPHGFLELRAGRRTGGDRWEDVGSLGEMRLQLELGGMTRQDLIWTVRADLVADALDDDRDRGAGNLDRGHGLLDLREANVQFAPTAWMDVKAGRQILTWGTGELLFINDLFPKDWQSFFLGRDQEYLKAPSDAVLVSLFSEMANLDIAVTPVFDPDRFITGERISYWDGVRIVGEDGIVDTDIPNTPGRDAEIAVRLSRNLKGYDIALYAYDGFWKSPAGADPANGRATFPHLRVYGASVVGAVPGGIGNLEIGFYDSRDDRDGTDPWVRNSELRVLAGYRRELAKELHGGVQYYLEHRLDHAGYAQAVPDTLEADENRHVVTLSLTKQLRNQTVTLHSFAYWSPSDEDAYIRGSAAWQLSDNWQATVGANVFLGRERHTFFGQFEDNTNLFFALRRSF